MVPVNAAVPQVEHLYPGGRNHQTGHGGSALLQGVIFHGQLDLFQAGTNIFDRTGATTQFRKAFADKSTGLFTGRQPAHTITNRQYLDRICRKLAEFFKPSFLDRFALQQDAIFLIIPRSDIHCTKNV